jgi:hypothetical protein
LPKSSQVKPFKNVNASTVKKMMNFLVPDQSHETKKGLIFRDLGFDAFNSQHKQVVKLFFNISL